MSTITVHLTEQDGATFRALARLSGKSEGHLAREVLLEYVRECLDDPDIPAALRALEKLSSGSKSLRVDGKVAQVEPDSSVGSNDSRNGGTAAHGVRTRRAVHGRSLANLPDGIEVTFRGVRSRITGGRMHIDGGVPFDSPSAAAVYVAGGGSFNGWREWKDDDGNELRALHDR